ncbi:MAG TPA: hypothetical protein PLP34_00755 [Chitinophagaceae bacterium]|nr:hypothetical protein [Chitinophagaceae bacterium]HNF70910.1 hypothetical protein [Chitinophagaceae bacterium]
MKRLLIPLFLFAGLQPLAAQQKALPHWVTYIDRTDINYYTALAEFDAWWKGKARPELDREEEHMSREERQEAEQAERARKKMSTEERTYDDLLLYHYKRFMNWKQEVRIFVQEDGHILSMDERLDLWKKQQDELKNNKK